MFWIALGLGSWVVLLAGLDRWGVTARPRRGWAVGGGSKRQKKVEARADDLGVQTMNRITQATELTPQEQARSGETFRLEDRLRPQLESRGFASGEDLVSQIGPLAARLQQMTGERLGRGSEGLFRDISPTAASYADLTQSELLNPRQIDYEDVSGPAFQLVRDQVKAEAARRGVTGSGLELENLGRAGIDFAIKQAQARTQNRILNEQLRQQAFERASGLISSQSALGDASRREAAGLTEFAAGQGTQARGELAQFLANQQNLQEAARNRQAGGVVSAQQASQPYFQGSVDALQTRVDQSRARDAGLAQLAIGAAAAPFTGGASLALAGGGLSNAFGGGGGGSMGAGASGNPTLDALLSKKRGAVVY